MNQTRDLVLSFGFNTETTELAHIIAKRMARFVKAARHTNSKKGRAPDDQRNAAAVLFASVVQTPPRDNTMRKSNDGLLDKKVMRALGVPAGSTHLLKQARKNRSDAMSSNDYRFL